MTEALFKYRLRVSPRGRTVRLRVTWQQGLEVVIPKDYDAARVPALLKRKRAWIGEALDRAESHRKFFEPVPHWRLPIQIKLPAIGAVWHVAVRGTDATWVSVRTLSIDQLAIFGGVEDEVACRAAMGRWLMRQTRTHLVPRLRTISLKLGLYCERAFVKRQRTRWASCSRHKTISLNSKLLFLPPELVDYVITHELCHTAEMNHSLHFWRLLEHHCPGYRRLDSRLREMWKVVPAWAVERRNGALKTAGCGEHR